MGLQQSKCRNCNSEIDSDHLAFPDCCGAPFHTHCLYRRGNLVRECCACGGGITNVVHPTGKCASLSEMVALCVAAVLATMAVICVHNACGLVAASALAVLLTVVSYVVYLEHAIIFNAATIIVRLMLGLVVDVWCTQLKFMVGDLIGFICLLWWTGLTLSSLYTASNNLKLLALPPP